MRVLVHQDDGTTLQAIELMLSYADLNAYTVQDGDEAIDLLKLYDYDLAIIEDVDILMHARRSRITTPMIVMSADDSTAAKLKAFGQGADDYVQKPFHREELIARIHSIIRRSQGHAHSTIQTGKTIVNLTSKTVESNGNTVHLTGKEYQMLELLSLRKGQTLTKEAFLNHLYGGMDEPELKIVDVFICKLRKKLAEASGGEQIVQTVWGRGYKLEDPVS